jgi:hypothetical protein
MTTEIRFNLRPTRDIRRPSEALRYTELHWQALWRMRMRANELARAYRRMLGRFDGVTPAGQVLDLKCSPPGLPGVRFESI